MAFLVCVVFLQKVLKARKEEMAQRRMGRDSSRWESIINRALIPLHYFRRWVALTSAKIISITVKQLRTHNDTHTHTHTDTHTPGSSRSHGLACWTEMTDGYI